MIVLDINSGLSEKKVQKMLKDLPIKTKPIIKKTLNNSAKTALKLIAKKTQQTYVVKSGAIKAGKSQFANIKINKASNSNLSSSIVFNSKKLELIKFKVSPARIQTGRKRPEQYKGHVLKASRMKPLGKYGNKAFLVKFKTGHISMGVRTTSKNRLPLKPLYSPAVPQLIGGYKVYGKVQPEISKILKEELKKQVTKALANYRG